MSDSSLTISVLLSFWFKYCSDFWKKASSEYAITSSKIEVFVKPNILAIASIKSLNKLDFLPSDGICFNTSIKFVLEKTSEINSFKSASLYWVLIK